MLHENHSLKSGKTKQKQTNQQTTRHPIVCFHPFLDTFKRRLGWGGAAGQPPDTTFRVRGQPRVDAKDSGASALGETKLSHTSHKEVTHLMRYVTH